MGIAQSASGLEVDPHGIWTSRGSAKLRYPESGNARCFELEDRSYWFEHRNDCIAAIVRRHPPQGCILDVGGGNGYVTKRLLSEGFDAALLEPGAVGAWNGKTRREIPEVICSTLEDAGFAKTSLPAAGCFDVIEHIDDDRRFLCELRDLLRPAGLLYATVPVHAWLWSLSDDVAQHCRRYDRAMLTALLRDNGFTLRYFSYFFAPLALPVLALRALPYRLGLVKRDNVLSDEEEHGTKGGLSVSIIKWLLSHEAARIARGDELRFGASALFVAQKQG
jgi:SAM-dependent methyltransferase